MKKIILAAVMLSSFLVTACSSGSGGQTFAEAHDAFQTKLTSQQNDQDEIPEPPAGLFELDYYDSKVGKLAAYVSGDPGDGGKHPLMIWVVGGWGNGIDDFPWSYAEWDNDQSAAAFREAGILMMYPSFRGGNGNPGYYETLFGEVDDIVSAYEYAASLPYVDPDRIYLGGHSTGGTRVLLASEYTDQFRAVFAFGPVDNVKYHNRSEFTFDTGSNDEYKLRSPIYWLQDIKSPTFVIEGEDGNAVNLRNIEKKSKNDHVSCFVVEGADHFSVLAPVNALLAGKIAADTGAQPNITLTQAELQAAMKQPPVISYPAMVPYYNEMLSFHMEMPAIWEEYDNSDEYIQYAFSSAYQDDNFWDSLWMYVDVYGLDEEFTYDEFVQLLNGESDIYECSTLDVNGQTALIAQGKVPDQEGNLYLNKVAVFQKEDRLLEFWFYIPEEYEKLAEPIISEVIESIILE